MVSALPNSRRASLDFRLFSYWVNLPSGRGVTMGEMMKAVDASEPQIIRSSLTRLRKGKVSDPSRPGSQLRPLPIRWNPADCEYYDMSKFNQEAVAAQIPGRILSGAFGELVNRVATLDSSMGQDGLVRSAQLLDDTHIRDLIGQLPLDQIWQIHATVLKIAQAKQFLELQSVRSGGSLSAPTVDKAEK